MLKLENVDAKYDSFKALDGVSMSVEQGELVVLLGANGAGKSTLFNTISGLLKASAGKISLNGEDVTGRKPSALVQAGVVQCPEGRKLFPEMSVLKKNSGSHCALRGYGREICIGKLMNLKLMNPMIQEDSIR